jgi:hypothetical protein
MYGSRERSYLEELSKRRAHCLAWTASATHPSDLEKRQEILRKEVDKNTLGKPNIKDEN